MKIFKKALSVFLAVLMLMSALSVSLVAFAADAQTDELYKYLAYSFFNYTRKSSGFTTTFVVNTDENGYPSKSIVGDMDQYTISNESDDYVYADTDSTPIRAVSYNHTVTASDDSQGHIRSAAENYFGIVDKIISKEYGVGNYTIPMLIDAVTEALKFYKTDDGEYLFLDGYTYLTDSYGNLVGRSEEKTYEVVNGEIQYFETGEEETDWRDLLSGGTSIRDLIAAGSVNELTLFEYCNVESVIAYFSGNCTTVNSGNWFHNFIFECDTDLETVLLTETLTAQNFTEKHYAITWTMNRQYDASGTKAQYYNNGYEVTLDTSSVNSTRRTLTDLQAKLDSYFLKYYDAELLPNTTNAQIISSYYNDIRTDYAVFNSLSNEAKIAVFGQSAYSYMNLVTQLTPIVDTTNIDKYLPSHTYERYTDSSGNNVTYKVTTDKVTTIVSTIDDLLKSEKIGTIIKTFIDFSDPQYEGKAFYGVEANTAQEVLVQVVQNYVYSDDIINLVIGKLYPLISNLIDENLNDALLDNLNLNSFVSGLLDWIIGSGGLQHLVNHALSLVGVVLTPAGMAWAWNYFGYLDESSNPGWSAIYKRNHDILQAARGGSGTQTANGQTYYSIGYETDAECGHRWDNLDTDRLVWGINGDRTKFQSVLSGVLLPLVPLLCVLLGNQEFQANDGSGHKGLPINTSIGYIFLSLSNLTLYNDVLLPLLEALEIPGLTSAADFETAAEKANSDSNRNPSSVAEFLNTILNPLLNWVESTVLADPITTILTLLPNISYYFTSGALLSSIKDIVIAIRISIWVDTAPINVYTLSVSDLLGDKLNFLTSLQGIIDLIGISVNTGIPIVGYYADGETKVYRPDNSAFDESTMTNAATTAYANVNGDLSLYADSEYTLEVTGLDADGNLNDYAIYDQVGWANSAGNVVILRNDTTATEDEYNIAVTKYYEYTVTDEETGETFLYRKTTPPADIDYTTVTDARMATANAKLPAIMDYKLQACGTVVSTSSGRYKSFSMTAKDGSSDTWNAYARKHIEMKINGIETEGLVLLYIFRYLFSALEYRAYDMDTQTFTHDYTLLDAFGLGDMLDKELISGLKLQDVIDNISLHPDEAIAALYELFYKNEFGSIYEILETASGKTVVSGSDYTYGLDYVNYYTDEIMRNAVANNDYTYGSTVLYTEYWSKEDSAYVVDNIDGIVDNVLAMLKLENGDSIGSMLEGLLSQYLFNNDLLSKLAGMLYGLLDSIAGVDLATILNAALDIDYSKKALYEALAYEFDGVQTEVYQKLYKDYRNGDYQYTSDIFYNMGIDEETGETVQLSAMDWGFENEEITAKYTDRQIFIRAISAIASPFAIIVKYLFCGDDLSILGVLNIPGYESYYYAWIPFMEALTATSGLLDYKSFYTKVFNGASTTAENCDAFYYAFLPAFNFVEDLLKDPIGILLNALPNLLFFLSIGGLNGVVNNFLHFAYVLLDILQPVLDVYPILNSLLSNIRIGSMTLNISIPLDLDINQLVNSLIDGVVGDLLSFDIENKNIQLGTQQVEKEVFVPDVDQNGEEVTDGEGNLIGHYETQTVTEPVYAVGTLKITLPYIDLATLCAGTVEQRVSISGQRYIFLNSSGGADLLTLLLRMVTETLFYKDNAINLANFLTGYCQLDDEDDNDELLMEIFTYLNDEAQANDIPDKSMGLIFKVYKVLVVVADNLGARFKQVDFSITDMFKDMDNITTYIDKLLSAGGNSTTELNAFARLIQLLKLFFAKLKAFFQGLFGRA